VARFPQAALRPILAAVAARPRRPLLVGIDGPGGSGKSTLAGELVRQLDGAVVVEGDDFYRDLPEEVRAALGPEAGYQQYFDWQRLRREVLVPVRDRRPALRYQRYDWEHARMGAWVTLPMPPVVVVEGVYTLRPALAELVDLKVFVATGEAVRLERQRARGENPDAWIGRWMAAEDHYLGVARPDLAADLVISGEVVCGEPGYSSSTSVSGASTCGITGST
jgi:phosphoribulokinase